ncbi:MAG: acetate--CoA ligase family protein [Streptosporangiaceae bacterium]
MAGPVDTTATAGQRMFRACIEAVAKDESVDAVMALTVPTALGDLTPAIVSATIDKPLVAVMLDQQESVRLLRRPHRVHLDQDAPGEDQPIPAYVYPEGAAQALGHAVRYSAWRAGSTGQVPDLDGINQDDARALVAQFLGTSHLGGWLPPDLVTRLLACYGIDLVRTRTVASADEAAHAAAELAGPVVLKADVPGLLHKSDVGAVLLDLRSEPDVRRGYGQLATRFGTDLRRVLVQPMITDGVEVLIGVVHEPVFGPLVVFGLGGVATDVLGDHVARLTPLTDLDVEQMLRGIRAAPLLYGHRGTAPVDVAALADLLLRVSRLADEIGEVAELDLNPVIASSNGVFGVDARIRLVPAEPTDPFLRRLR